MLFRSRSGACRELRQHRAYRTAARPIVFRSRRRGVESTGRPPGIYFRIPKWIKWTYLKSGKILLAEQYRSEPVIFQPSSASTGLPKHVKLRHGGRNTVNKDKVNGGNYLFADGHVEYSTEYHRACNSAATGNLAFMMDNYKRWWDHGTLMGNY